MTEDLLISAIIPIIILFGAVLILKYNALVKELKDIKRNQASIEEEAEALAKRLSNLTRRYNNLCNELNFENNTV